MIARLVYRIVWYNHEYICVVYVRTTCMSNGIRCEMYCEVTLSDVGL